MSKLNIKKIILSLFVSFMLAESAFCAEFKDVAPNYWAFYEIDKFSKENIINSDNNNLFHPDKEITRAEFSQMVIKALDKENMQVDTIYSFNDVNNNHWAWEYIIRAVDLDILKPFDNNYFYPDEHITRSEIIVFLTNILRTEDISKNDALLALQKNYKDYDEIPDWLKINAGKAEVINVIAKEPPREEYLDYDKYVSKAQAVVFLSKMKREIDSYLKQQIEEETSPKIAEGIITENTSRKEDVVTIFAQTVLPIVVLGQLSSTDAQAGQMFQAKFANNIVDSEHHVLFSKDIILVGKVLDASKARKFINNGSLLFELSAVNNQNLFTKILGVSECEAQIIEANKLKKAAKTVLKGNDFTVKDGQIIYIKLFKPIRVNIVTGEVFD